MLNPRENMVIIDGVIKTIEIHSINVSNRGNKYNILFKGSKNKWYSYSPNNVLWLTSPTTFNPAQYNVYFQEKILPGVSYIAAFKFRYRTYWFLECANGKMIIGYDKEIVLKRSCLADQQSKHIFKYLCEVAALNPLKAEDSNTPLLLKQYQVVDFIEEDRAIAPYLNPKSFHPKKFDAQPLIFPFGCNASQQMAVRAAFENQISIIQGPPGTGKTQTILNIVANIVAQGKTVMVVSNNNSAIENVVEKMVRYNIGFITALLGSRENKESFIAAQETEKLIPANIKQWHSTEADKAEYLLNIDKRSKTLADVFAKQERLALARQELNALKVEKTHFEQEVEHNNDIFIRKSLSSAQLLSIWNKLEEVADGVKYSGFFSNLVNAIRDFIFNYKIHRYFGGVADKPTLDDIISLIPIVQRAYYEEKYPELIAEITKLEEFLSLCDTSAMVKSLQEESICYLHNIIYKKYGKDHKRPIFTLRSMGEEMIKEYPVVLSTTFSSRTNFHIDTVFDYVIMDEASQISAETGALALMCAKNAVIVGDSMQLPNVVTEEDKLQLQALATKYNIAEQYDCANNSFLKSVCKVLPDAPQTLLREHYRCHPKIINFCNQKFYGGKLIIMTQDNGEEDVISAKRTTLGNHSRGKMNQREVDVILQEVLPTLSFSDKEVGIIAPYNGQVDALNNAFGGRVDVATVHKFQGREKDAIIMSTVDDTITEFSDDPNLLNVAISRAKQKFCLIVSGNEQPKDCNIADLLAYIEYNNCSVTDSNIHSIFDLLYNQYAQARFAYLKAHNRVSEYDSENLTYALLEQVIEENSKFSHLGVICHQPLRQLLRDVSLLSDEDKTYALHPKTHIDFLLYNRVSKKPVLAIETDGYYHHKAGTEQSVRDEKKNRILSLYGIPLLRLSTIGSNERQQVEDALNQIV